MNNPRLTIGQCSSLACLLEAAAPKPGNVHRGADFEDLTFVDLATAGIAIAPAMDRAASQSLGRTVLEAITATRQFTKTNANLGIVLLMAPLAAVPRDEPLTTGLAKVLSTLTADDCRDVYEAIRLAKPGGLGQTATADIHAEPPADLIVAMRLAAERDLVARQYANGFREVLTMIVPKLQKGVARGWSLSDTIVRTHLETMCEFPDSLIARKCGPAVAQQAADRAATVLAVGEPGDDEYLDALADLDFWLRSDGHRRNPGTTADLIAAGLFAALREGIINPSCVV